MTGISSAFNNTLIDAYMQCPGLYDCDHPDYKMPMPTMKCWEKVAEECASTQIDCRIRWKALRDRYIKERKRLMEHPNEYNRKNWLLYDKMDFLNPFVEKQRQRFPRNAIGSTNGSRAPNYSKYMNTSVGLASQSMSHSPGMHIKGEYEDGGSFDYSDGSNCEDFDQKCARFSTNFQVLKACEDLEASSGNGSLNEPLDGEKPLVIAQNEEDEIMEVMPVINHKRALSMGMGGTATNDDEVMPASTSTTPSSNRMRPTQQQPSQNGFPTRSFLPAVRRKQRLQQCRVEPKCVEQEQQQQQAALLDSLRSTVESLMRMSESLLEENEEAIFGRYVAAVLHNMSSEKRNQVKLQIFGALHAVNGDTTSPENNNTNNNNNNNKADNDAS